MDPVTHGLIGLGISAFSGEPVSMTHAIGLGSMLGAMAPDIDIVLKLKGNYTYLKHHRGLSHSLPALLILAGIITIGLSFFYDIFDVKRVFIWTFIGTLSHTLFDILNSYGAKLCLPFTSKKYRIGILMLYDPVITILSGLLIVIPNKPWWFLILIMSSFFIYLHVRFTMKYCAMKKVKEHFKDEEISNLYVLPSLTGFYKWHYITETIKYCYVGSINIKNNQNTHTAKFEKSDPDILKLFKRTQIGQYMNEFTPVFHVKKIEKDSQIIIQCTDLRYYFKNNFMHHATVVLDKEWNVVESFFHPYKIEKNIRVIEKSTVMQ